MFDPLWHLLLASGLIPDGSETEKLLLKIWLKAEHCSEGWISSGGLFDPQRIYKRPQRARAVKALKGFGGSRKVGAHA